MSRDHYKGIPKTRDAVVRADGTVVPLSKTAPDEGVTVAADFLTINKRDTLETKFIYARSTGDDANGDGSLANPYRTFARAVQDLPVFADNTIWHIDITGIGEEVLTEKFTMPPFISSFDQRLTTAHPVYNQYVTEAALNISAVPTTLETFTPTGTATNSTTGMRNYTDSAKSWTPDEFKGKFLVGSNLTEVATIYSNDSTTVYTTHNVNFTAPLKIVEPSASLKYGPSVDTYYEGSFILQGVLSPISFGGIKFDKNSAAGRTFIATAGSNMNFVFCDFPEFALLYGGGNTIIDACHFNGDFSQDGVGITMRYAFLENGTFSAHGSGGLGLDSWLSCRFEGKTDALGHGGNNEAEIAYSYQKCSVDSIADYGFEFHGGNRCRIQNCEVDNCSNSAVFAEGPGLLMVEGVTGTGNTNYGVEVTNGAQVMVNSSTTVSGDLEDVKVGVLSPESWTSFRTGYPADLDITAVSGTLSRVYQE